MNSLLCLDQTHHYLPVELQRAFDDAVLTNAAFPIWMLHRESLLVKAYLVAYAAPQQFVFRQTTPTLADLSVSHLRNGNNDFFHTRLLGRWGEGG